jgi:hypothetical protein
MEGKLPSVLTFTYVIVRNSILSAMAYAIIYFNNRITYVINKVLTSKHDCLYGEHATYYTWLESVVYENFEYLWKIYLSAKLVVYILIVKYFDTP